MAEDSRAAAGDTRLLFPHHLPGPATHIPTTEIMHHDEWLLENEKEVHDQRVKIC